MTGKEPNMSLKAFRDELAVTAGAAHAHVVALAAAARAANIAAQNAKTTLATASAARGAAYDAYYAACDAVHNESAP